MGPLAPFWAVDLLVMEKTLKVINDLEQEGVIERYAIGGATALLFYAEPSLTFDVDVFVFLRGQKDPNRLINLSPLYEALAEKGYAAEKEHVIIEGIPVQFIPVYNALVEEAVSNASEKKYEGTKTKVLGIEYLLAIMIDTNRPRDRERIKKLVDEVECNKKLLEKILDKHSLRKRWKEKVENE